MAMAVHKGRTPPPPPAPKPDAIEVDFGELLFDDLVLFQQSGDQVSLTPEVIEALDRVVVGGIRRRKVKELEAIMTAIADQAKAKADAGN